MVKQRPFSIKTLLNIDGCTALSVLCVVFAFIALKPSILRAHKTQTHTHINIHTHTHTYCTECVNFNRYYKMLSFFPISFSVNYSKSALKTEKEKKNKLMITSGDKKKSAKEKQRKSLIIKNMMTLVENNVLFFLAQSNQNKLI